MKHAAPESEASVSLFRWLTRPASWSGPEKLAMLCFFCISASVLTVGVSSFAADLLAVAAYGALVLLILLLAWRRFSSHD